jgi:hypothetical protein
MRPSKQGSVCFDTRSKKWCLYWWENGTRKSKTIGPASQFPTKASAWRAVSQAEKPSGPTVLYLCEAYRLEKMPRRASTRRGYELWLKNYIAPKWGSTPITAVTARPVELWLQSLDIAPKKPGSRSGDAAHSLGVQQVGGTHPRATKPYGACDHSWGKSTVARPTKSDNGRVSKTVGSLRRQFALAHVLSVSHFFWTSYF